MAYAMLTKCVSNLEFYDRGRQRSQACNKSVFPIRDVIDVLISLLGYVYGVQLQYKTRLNSHLFFMFNKAPRTKNRIKLRKMIKVMLLTAQQHLSNIKQQ